MSDSLFARFGREYPAGTCLFREGEDGAEMFVIQAGQVQITKQAAGVERPLATLGRGEFLGEMAILNGNPRTATATVIEDARCLVIDAKTLEAMISKNTEIAMRLIKKLSRRLDSADALIQILLNPDPKARVMLALKRHAEAFGENTTNGVRILVTPQDLAQEVGIDVSLVHEVLARLRRLRLMAQDERSGGLLITDVGRLLEFLDFLEVPRKAEGA